jgi:hypothetical protein
MAEIIQDGRTGNTMRVDTNSRASVQALTVDAALDAHLQSNAYDVSTGQLVDLGGVDDSALLYIKNLGDPDLVVETIFIDTGDSNIADLAGTLTWWLNPDATGTIVTEAVAAQVLNRRIGSPVNLSATSYTAAVGGKTLAGGSTISLPFPQNTGVPFAKPFVIPKGQAFGVSYQAPVGTTAMLMQVGVLLIIDTTDIV